MNHHLMQGRARSLDARLPGLTFLLLLALLLQACECDPTDPDGPRYLVYGLDMSGSYQNIHVRRDGQPVNDAAVTVNREAIARAGDGYYHGKLPASVPARGLIGLQVRSGSARVHGIGSVPEAPVLTGPTTGRAFGPLAAIPVTWTSATNPDRFRVNASWVEGEGGHGRSYHAPGSARSLEIPARELPRGVELTVTVFAYNDGTFTGAVDPASRMRIRGENGSNAVITVETLRPR